MACEAATCLLRCRGASDCALGVRAVPEPCGSTVGPWQSYGRAASRAGLIVCKQQEQTDDLSFAARHAPYELLERRGISTKKKEARPSWPPSTKRTSIFLSPGRTKVEPGDAYHDASAHAPGVARSTSLDTALSPAAKNEWPARPASSVGGPPKEPDWVRG